MRFDAVIFDMDGVLIDSEPLWQEAEIEVFARSGVVLTRDMCRSTMGLRVDEVVRHWHAAIGWDEPPVDEVIHRVVDRMGELIRERGELLPGARAALDFLRAEGVPTGLASSSWMVLIRTVLDAFSIAGSFDAVRSAAQEPRGKPDPAVYLSTARDLNVAPDRCIAIEDSPNGVRAARAAGMFCIGIPEGSEVDLSEADMLLAGLEELPAAWERLRTPSTS